MILEELEAIYLSIIWVILIIWTSYIGIFRTFIDRIRSGLVATPEAPNRVTRLVRLGLQVPNHERPFHVEAALLSSIQVLFGFVTLATFSENLFSYSEHPLSYVLILFFAVAIERISSWLYPRKISQSSHLKLHLKIGLPVVILVQFICKPLASVLSFMEKSLQSRSQRKSIQQEEASEVADHIRTIGREAANLDPNVIEIMGNTLEMSQLKVKDVMIPRNLVQILDASHPFGDNLEVAKSCGHTRIPLCEGDLDHCVGIIHVKYAFKSMASFESGFDLRKITKPPSSISGEEPLPVALKRMMRLKVHMALVRDEFGGIDGVITLEDILEEVVGEIQDEFDAEEKNIETISKQKWKISGLVSVHELPQELQQKLKDDEMATIGGMITREIGRIPTRGEKLSLFGLEIMITEADETRVLGMEIKYVEEEISQETISEEKE